MHVHVCPVPEGSPSHRALASQTGGTPVTHSSAENNKIKLGEQKEEMMEVKGYKQLNKPIHKYDSNKCESTNLTVTGQTVSCKTRLARTYMTL